MTVKKDEQNQATKLQELFNEVTQHEQEQYELKQEGNHEEDEPNRVEENGDGHIEEDQMIHIDVLNLPPRSDVHKPSRRSVTISIGRPFIRLSFVIIVLLVIVGVIYFYDDMIDMLSLLKRS